jgi:alpha/beta hydrolase fold/Luciferase-like monooxygenase
MRLLTERMLAMKEIWIRDVASFHGEFVDFDDIWMRPKPALRPHPPVFIGGSGPTVFDRVPAFGDAWALNWNHVVDKLERRIAEAVCRWAAQNPAELGLKSPGLVPGGDSAGGNLTFATTIAPRDRPAALPVLAQPAIYPSTDETRSYPSEQTFAEGYLLTEAGRRWCRKHNQIVPEGLTDQRRPRRTAADGRHDRGLRPRPGRRASLRRRPDPSRRTHHLPGGSLRRPRIRPLPQRTPSSQTDALTNRPHRPAQHPLPTDPVLGRRRGDAFIAARWSGVWGRGRRRGWRGVGGVRRRCWILRRCRPAGSGQGRLAWGRRPSRGRVRRPAGG